jgi:hypothetical protein
MKASSRASNKQTHYKHSSISGKRTYSFLSMINLKRRQSERSRRWKSRQRLKKRKRLFGSKARETFMTLTRKLRDWRDIKPF